MKEHTHRGNSQPIRPCIFLSLVVHFLTADMRARRSLRDVIWIDIPLRDLDDRRTDSGARAKLHDKLQSESIIGAAKEREK